MSNIDWFPPEYPQSLPIPEDHPAAGRHNCVICEQLMMAKQAVSSIIVFFVETDDPHLKGCEKRMDAGRMPEGVYEAAVGHVGCIAQKVQQDVDPEKMKQANARFN